MTPLGLHGCSNLYFPAVYPRRVGVMFADPLSASWRSRLWREERGGQAIDGDVTPQYVKGCGRAQAALEGACRMG